MAKVKVSLSEQKRAAEAVRVNAKNKPAAQSVAALRERVETLEAALAELLKELGRG